MNVERCTSNRKLERKELVNFFVVGIDLAKKNGLHKKRHLPFLHLLFLAFCFLFSLPLLTFASTQPPGKFPQPQKRDLKNRVEFSDFVGSQVCAGCHQEEYDLWKGSTHGMAGGTPSQKTVISTFDGTILRFKDAVIRLSVSQDKKYTFEVQQENQAAQRFTAHAVVGGGHMLGGGTQTFFTQFADGSLRFLPFDFIKKENLWFCETRHNKGWVPITGNLSISDCRQWPPYRKLGSDLCQGCHGSQITMLFDSQKKRYVTQYKTLQINCESCHGPGKKHVEITSSDNWNDLEDLGMKPLSTLTKDESLSVCFRCHAIKRMLGKADYLPGRDMEEHYSLLFPTVSLPAFFSPDGRVKTFAYQKNHLYSDCYLNGSMTCVDCHNPHDQSYRDITGKLLPGKLDNGQCTGCHASKKIAPATHSHHKKGSEGSRCVNCHMPFLQHKAAGNKLRFTRSDHSIPIPRPGFDSDLGIKNACKICHQEKKNAFLQKKVTQWYGKIKPHKPLVTDFLRKKNLTQRKKTAALYLKNSPAHPALQIEAMSFFIKTFLLPDMPNIEKEIVAQLKLLAGNTNIDIRSLALAALHLIEGNNQNIQRFLRKTLLQLGSQDYSVRMRWAQSLGDLGSFYKTKRDLKNSSASYQKALEIYPDNPTMRNTFALVRIQLNDIRQGFDILKRSTELYPENHEAYYNLGVLFMDNRDMKTAAQYYKKTLDLYPFHVEANNNMGNILLMEKKTAQAMQYYKNAVEANPKHREGQLNLGMTLFSLGKYDEAISHYSIRLSLAPKDALAHSLVGEALEKVGKKEKAIQHLSLSIQLDPQNPQPHITLGNIYQSQGNVQKAFQHFSQAQQLR